MDNVDDIFNLYTKLTRKNKSAGVSSTDLFYFWNSEQTAYFEDLKGRWQRNSNGKSGQNTGLIENETILTKLLPFTVPATLSIVAGNIDKPDDCVYRLAFRVNGVDCIKINHNQIATVNGSTIDPPSITDNKFYFVEYERYCYLLPRTLPTVAITEAELDYLRQPKDIKWGFTLDVQKRKVYNSGTSVQPEWAVNDIIEITKRSLTGMGVSFKDKDFEQFGQKTQITGN